MKIAVLSTTVFPIGISQSPVAGLVGYGGLEEIAWQCAKGLAELGHQVLLMAPDGSNCPNVQVIHTGPAGQHSEQEAYGGKKERNWGGYWPFLLQVDAVVDHTWMKQSVMLKAERGAACPPILSVCHAPVQTMFKDLPQPGISNFICISEDQANTFRALYQRDCRVCYNGVDSNFYKPLGIPRSNRFLFLARFSKIKGALIAIQACKEAGVGLDLIGDTQITNEPDYVRACLELADGEQIKIIGNQPRGSCVYWMSQAHAFLHPVKEFQEPFGLAPVEAQLCGTPVISWNNGAMSETIGNGILVKNEKQLVDAIKSWSEKDSIKDSTRTACISNGKRFSIERMARRYETLIREAKEQPWS